MRGSSLTIDHIIFAPFATMPLHEGESCSGHVLTDDMIACSNWSGLAWKRERSLLLGNASPGCKRTQLKQGCLQLLSGA